MLVIIQARISSKRFHGKVLKKLNKIPIILNVVNCIKKSMYVSDIVVSTSNEKSDDILVDLLKKYKVNVFRGSLNNVALRLYNTAIKQNKNYFIRVSGDSPFLDYKILNELVKIYKKNSKYDIITNVFPRSYPSGQSFEIIKTSIIKKNIKNMNKFEKEHVTSYFYKNSKNFLIKNLLNKNFKNNFKMSVDTKKDLNFLKKKRLI